MRRGKDASLKALISAMAEAESKSYYEEQENALNDLSGLLKTFLNRDDSPERVRIRKDYEAGAALTGKGGIRQRAALADIVAGKQLFDVVLEIGGLFGGHFHAASAEYRRIHGGVQHVQNGLMNDDLHGSYLVFIRISLAYSIAQPGPKGESTSCKPSAGMLQ